MVAFVERRVRDAWMTNRKSIAIFIRNLRGGKEDKKEELAAKLKANNGGVKWGKRAAVAASITPFVWGMKAEVESAEEAVKLIGQGVWWEGKKYKVELWRNARARALHQQKCISGSFGSRWLTAAYSAHKPNKPP